MWEFGKSLAGTAVRVGLCCCIHALAVHRLGPNGIKLNVAPIMGEMGSLGVVRPHARVMQFYLPSGIESYFK